MFQLLPREQALLVFILAATLLGAAVKHWRDVQRERRAAAAISVAPASFSSPEPATALAEGRADR